MLTNYVSKEYLDSNSIDVDKSNTLELIENYKDSIVCHLNCLIEETYVFKTQSSYDFNAFIESTKKVLSDVLNEESINRFVEELTKQEEEYVKRLQNETK